MIVDDSTYNLFVLKEILNNMFEDEQNGITI